MGVEQSHETHPSSTKDHVDGCRYWADFDNEYFAKGTYRYAFRGTVHGDGPRDGSLCVTKVFKKQYAKYFDKWRPDLAASLKAQKFAAIFSANVLPLLRNYITTQDVEFVIPLIAKMDTLSHFKVLGLFPVNEDNTYVEPYEYVAIEPYLYGTFEKFNSNGGFEDETAAVLNAFSHWTWTASGHKFLVCDLQGVQNGRKYVLTDPCIHSVDGRYGMTDLGVVGMEKVLSNHACNALCHKLGLENPLSGIDLGTRRSRATQYIFQLSDTDHFRAAEARTHYFTLAEPLVQ
ncbi:myosin heavy chain kinase B-like isoform X2 [Mercenaria mercenaria]|nr:myosin heavy chain kinase B-like isoform X2 [Mercenaria mercenaria]XP_045192617.1 myosin heavy chain kinase B-like isoform X2 [Mercenaria mercenaria]XP_045192618.1 myosin heavy chain kinase B-like isoform X2 [Mercenaria mercenaria]XP_045192619.1 myosin heavy chain kinase B-like isoform X2 [Mercenaria mercenaria]XP_053401800.1 myosin heavy chain kinase B-like isoform X2 [Mercenaria mercenaria]